MLTQERLKELLDYDPETGIFTRKTNQGGRNGHFGATAGTQSRDGYIYIHIDRHKYASHRLAFLWMAGGWPADQTDHINRVRTDNRWENLRDVTNAQNQYNTGLRSHNTSGHTGVSWDKSRQKWTVHIKAMGAARRLGRYVDKSDAIAHRHWAEISYRRASFD